PPTATRRRPSRRRPARRSSRHGRCGAPAPAPGARSRPRPRGCAHRGRPSPVRPGAPAAPTGETPTCPDPQLEQPGVAPRRGEAELGTRTLGPGCLPDPDPHREGLLRVVPAVPGEPRGLRALAEVDETVRDPDGLVGEVAPGGARGVVDDRVGGEVQPTPHLVEPTPPLEVTARLQRGVEVADAPERLPRDDEVRGR